MSKAYSIAEARNRLPRLVRTAERGGAIAITRRGAPVAVLVSTAQWERLQGGKTSFWKQLVEFRRTVEPADFPPRSVFEGLRSTSPGRPVKL